jgi:hypothetical protein
VWGASPHHLRLLAVQRPERLLGPGLGPGRLTEEVWVAVAVPVGPQGNWVSQP